MQIALLQHLSKFRLDRFSEARQRVLAGGVEIEHAFCNRDVLRIYFNCVV